MRAMQANLSYLAFAMGSAQNNKKYNLPGPAIMSSPILTNQGLVDLYAKLVELFDGWKGSQKATGIQQGGNPNVANSKPGSNPGPNAQGAAGMGMQMGTPGGQSNFVS
jgi:hypothetical protein